MPMSTREYPKVWGRFERTVEDGGTLTFEISDIPESMWSTAVEFMLGNYIREDVWWAAVGTAKSPEAVQEYRVLLTSIVKQKMSLACFLAVGDGSGHTLVGVNICLPQEKGRFIEHSLVINDCVKPPKSIKTSNSELFSYIRVFISLLGGPRICPGCDHNRTALLCLGVDGKSMGTVVMPKTKAGLLSLRMFVEAMKVTVIYDKYKVNEYLMGAGLSVTPEYRGLGIGVELLKARMELACALGFKATGGIFTSIQGQRVAEKSGMECLYEIPYKKFGKQCNVTFDTVSEHLKIYGKKTERQESE